MHMPIKGLLLLYTFQYPHNIYSLELLHFIKFQPMGTPSLHPLKPSGTVIDSQVKSTLFVTYTCKILNDLSMSSSNPLFLLIGIFLYFI